MTTTTYRIDAKEQQQIYGELVVMANQTRDDDTLAGETKMPQSIDLTISQADIDSYLKTKKQSEMTLRVFDVTRSAEVLIHSREKVQKIFTKLLERDADRDGRIDDDRLSEDLVVIYNGNSDGISEKEAADRVVEKYQNSIFAVRVSHGDAREYAWEGTAFIYKRMPKPDGSGYTYHALTNAHVAADKVTKETGFQLYNVQDKILKVENVEFLGADILADVAVLQFDFPERLEECPLAIRAPSLNETIVEIGNTEAEGVIPLTGKIVDLDSGLSGYSYMGGDNYSFRVYKMHIDSRGGNSGSPVFNLDGEVIGQHFAGEGIEGSPYRYTSTGDRLGKAYKNIVAHADAQGVAYADWGFYPVPLKTWEYELLLPPELNGVGVSVAKVHDDSPAAKASVPILPNDIIVGINGDKAPVTVPSDQYLYRFLTAVLDSEPGKKIRLDIYRKDVGFIRTELVPKETSYVQPQVYETDYGFNAVELTDDKRKSWGVPDNIKGVLSYITRRNDRGEPAESILGGLEETNIITKVDGVTTTDIASFEEAFSAAIQKDRPFFMEIYRCSYLFGTSSGGVGSHDRIKINP